MTERTNEVWLTELKQPDSVGEIALQDLRNFILRGILGYLRTRSDLSRIDQHDLQQLAEDTAQDALLKIRDKLDTFQGKSKFTTWATKIAINHLISDLRRQRWKDISLNAVLDSGTTLEDMISTAPDDSNNPALATERSLVWNSVQAVLKEGLTERQRQAIVATQLRGVPMQEAARMLDTNTNNLYKLIHDARLKIKRNLVSQGLDPAYILELFS